ncbi:hypothetical protein NUSPORA_02058 [Nucleospora cyclopteri]
MFTNKNTFTDGLFDDLSLTNRREKLEKDISSYNHSGVAALRAVKMDPFDIKLGKHIIKRENKDKRSNYDEFEREYPSRQNNNETEEDLYENNGGTTLAITIDNKLIIAADTRLSADYDIYTRRKSKIYKIGDFYLTTAGFSADGYNVFLSLLYQLKKYEKYKKMKISSVARLLHHILYSRRFFPLYSYCTLSGYENNEATVYSFDCVGSYEKTPCRVDGTGTKMIQPLLDSWIRGNNFENFKKINFGFALNLVKKAFDSAAESDINTGDFLEVIVVDENGEKRELFELRKD